MSYWQNSMSVAVTVHFSMGWFYSGLSIIHIDPPHIPVIHGVHFMRYSPHISPSSYLYTILAIANNIVHSSVLCMFVVSWLYFSFTYDSCKSFLPPLVAGDSQTRRWFKGTFIFHLVEATSTWPVPSDFPRKKQGEFLSYGRPWQLKLELWQLTNQSGLKVSSLTWPKSCNSYTLMKYCRYWVMALRELGFLLHF